MVLDDVVFNPQQTSLNFFYYHVKVMSEVEGGHLVIVTNGAVDILYHTPSLSTGIRRGGMWVRAGAVWVLVEEVSKPA